MTLNSDSSAGSETSANPPGSGNVPPSPFVRALESLTIDRELVAEITTKHKITSLDDFEALGRLEVPRLLKRIASGGKVAVPGMDASRLSAFQYWAEHRRRLGRQLDPALFTASVCTDWIRRRAELEAVKEDASEDRPQEPEKFKDVKKWKQFRDDFDSYLSRLKGANRVPLNYVIRDREAPPDGEELAAITDDHEELVRCVPLSGSTYKADNHAVYDKLKSLTANGPAHPWIRPFANSKDGRKAWLAICLTFDGESYQKRSADEARSILRGGKNIFQGVRRSQTFETFISRQKDAHEDLERAGEALSEKEKVNCLIDNIKV